MSVSGNKLHYDSTSKIAPSRVFYLRLGGREKQSCAQRNRVVLCFQQTASEFVRVSYHGFKNNCLKKLN